MYKNGFDTGRTTLTGTGGYYGILTTASSTPGIDNYSARFAGDESYLPSESPLIFVTVTIPTYKVFGYVESEGLL